MKKLDNSTVEGEGFRITVPDIHHVVYSCGPHIAEVEIEGGSVDEQVDWLVYASTLTTQDGDDEFLKMNRERILTRISRALTLLGMQHSVEGFSGRNGVRP